ncbi:hypothetical protein MC7420_429 [Coleofasciculus chthonoplastes PCC 7420]|uniref:Uncharacterized protein n=1 Tax=Coleofasciculus chthonoplastes PCC 7420 TaxID=118168 RepID=B4VLU3_9CYAN|nr:hypothetical protein [Coleofasciculus chthonoplastes]EDX77292.1 hypothetical protein MC7420_429 [Coleofasciculus chthonoplastes PCC 7420]
MSVRDPRILIQILDDLIQEIGRCTERVRNTLQKASYTQRCAQEQIERGLHSANVFKDWVECDRENVQDADAEVANLLSKCSEAEQVSHETLDEVEEVFHYAQVTLQQWKQELNKALAWLERAKARLERAIQEENAAQRNWESAQDEMKQAEIRWQRCLNDTERRNCNREKKAYELARLNVKQALERWQAAKIEVSLAKEEVAQAQARVNCCRQAVDYAKQAVAQAQLALEHANQAVNSAERSLEEAEASNRFMVSAQTKVTEETDLTEQMILAVHQAQTLTSEAQIHYQNGEYAADSAQRLATLGCQELEYRVQALYSFNSSSSQSEKTAGNRKSILHSINPIKSQVRATINITEQTYSFKKTDNEKLQLFIERARAKASGVPVEVAEGIGFEKFYIETQLDPSKYWDKQFHHNPEEDRRRVDAFAISEENGEDVIHLIEIMRSGKQFNNQKGRKFKQSEIYGDTLGRFLVLKKPVKIKYVFLEKPETHQINNLRKALQQGIEKSVQERFKYLTKEENQDSNQLTTDVNIDVVIESWSGGN